MTGFRITDFTAAFGRLRDPTAHVLLTSSDWRAMLTGGHPLMVDANKSIATSVFACLLELTTPPVAAPIEDEEEDEDICYTVGPVMLGSDSE